MNPKKQTKGNKTASAVNEAADRKEDDQEVRESTEDMERAGTQLNNSNVEGLGSCLINSSRLGFNILIEKSICVRPVHWTGLASPYETGSRGREVVELKKKCRADQEDDMAVTTPPMEAVPEPPQRVYMSSVWLDGIERKNYCVWHPDRPDANPDAPRHSVPSSTECPVLLGTE
ncbi:hypothetical protein M5K25_026167 [Dendrobium thyrsiflorum]|uniref:Uncharacterized protein n=1 Tax=Dendrobium thyrsiflorum TaxID=117978 RepID=A0ABD0TWM1_DENTH